MADGALSEDRHACHRLEKRLEHLELTPMLPMHNPGAEASLDGAVYRPEGRLPGISDLVGGAGSFQPQGGNLEALEFRFQGDEAQLICHQDGEKIAVDLGLCGHFATTVIGGTPYGANSAWRRADVLEVEMRNSRMATGKRFRFHFTGDRLEVEADSTLPEPAGLGELDKPQLRFRLDDGQVNTRTRQYWEVNG